VSVHQLLFPHPFSYTISTSSTVRAPENTEESTVDAEPANEGDVQMLYISE
jgi:hypothetical protein